jgi:hypothetical protein
MTSEEQSTGVIHGSSEGGIAASHPLATINPILVGPSTSNEHNVISTSIIPIACWRVDDLRFDFDSSFVRPEIGMEIRHLAELREKHKIAIRGRMEAAAPVAIFPTLSIFGHADPVGNDDYNKQLSGRRATAIYGLLTRKTNLWEGLYSSPFGGDNWGNNALVTMRQAVQQQAGSRQQLFRSYMDALCTLLDENGKPVIGPDGQPLRLELSPEDFFARGADPGGKGDYQGCGEFNPLVLFSQREQREFAQRGREATRNQENAPNRRVLVLLFRPGSSVVPSKWPCPRVNEGTAGCHRRFWSDGEKRRSKLLPDERRFFEETKDTFACRFYHRLTTQSPCERFRPSVVLRLYDPGGNFIANAPYQFSVGNQTNSRSGKADAQGFLRAFDVPVPSTCIVKWGPPPDSPDKPIQYPYQLEVFIDIQDGNADEAMERLNNLGYPREDSLGENVGAFQRDYGDSRGLRKDGTLDDATLAAIREVHDTCADHLGDNSTQS